MCLLDEPVWHASAIMALGALVIMLVNVWQSRMIAKHRAELQALIDAHTS